MSVAQVSKKFLVVLLLKKRKPREFVYFAVDKRDCIAQVQKQYRTETYRILEVKEL